jgi:hypothetical protein
MSKAVAPGPTESRWPAIIAILAVFAVLELLPGRIRLLPEWFPFLAAFLLVAPMIGMALSHNVTFVHFERVVIYLFVMLSIIVMALTLLRLIQVILGPASEYGANFLLASAIEVYIINVISFGLLYWQLDRGGPERRGTDQEHSPDILFPEGLPASSQPFTFIDYLFFAYTTSTAFSPTEMFPITRRMKILMMLQSTFSLVTILVVASRAINILR